MLNIVLLSVTICHFHVLSFKIFRIIIDFGMGGMGFDPQAIQIGHSAPTARHLSNVSPLCFEAVLARLSAAKMSPATRVHTLT